MDFYDPKVKEQYDRYFDDIIDNFQPIDARKYRHISGEMPKYQIKTMRIVSNKSYQKWSDI